MKQSMPWRRQQSTAASLVRSLNPGPGLPQPSPSGSLHSVAVAVTTVTLSFLGLVFPGATLLTSLPFVLLPFIRHVEEWEAGMGISC